MTTEPNPAPVSQRARKYAWEGRPGAFRDGNPATREAWMAGHCDFVPVVKAFARFEEAKSTRIAELEEALRPFKRAMEDWGDDNGQPDRWNIWEHPVAMNITLGDLRRA